MLVDEIFALYLYRMSNRINRTYYRTVLAYVIFFRECLNEYGWGKKIESEGIKLENNPEMKNDIANKQFCLVNNAEHAPEICNEFVTVYMEYKKSIIDIPKHDQIDLTINLCHWLFQCQFTCSKLTMIGWVCLIKCFTWPERSSDQLAQAKEHFGRKGYGLLAHLSLSLVWNIMSDSKLSIIYG